MSEARTLFMHAHMLLPNLNKYMARYDTCANTKYYHLEFHLFFLHPPAVPLKIDFMQCTNLIGIQVLSHSVKDLETQHWLDNCECPKNTRWILQGIVNFKLPYGFYILWPCLQNFYGYQCLHAEQLLYWRIVLYSFSLCFSMHYWLLPRCI